MRRNNMKIQVNNKNYEFKSPQTLEQIKNEVGLKNAVAAEINGRLRELTYIVDEDTTVNFLDLTNSDAVRIYEASLRYLFAMALYELNPALNVRFNYSISRSILAVIEPEMNVTENFL